MPRQSQSADYTLVRNADRAQTVAALSRISVSSTGDWLPPTNLYASDAQARIRADLRSVPDAQVQDFAEYLAAGAFVHCGDAWSYLGRALDALLRGDVHAAVHLAYYAELRGAISLLSTEGVFVGDFYTCAVTASGTAHRISNESTHQSIWKSLDEWNRSDRSSAVIGQILRPGGVELDSWASTIPHGATAPMIADLLNRMKFDLQSFAGDRDRRNVASYNPSRLKVADLRPESARRVVSNIWTALEPDARGTFPVLDRFLLRDILTTIYSAVHKVDDENGEPTDVTDWSSWEVWLDSLIPAQAISTALYDSLLSVPDGNTPSLLSAAFTQRDDTSPSRAFIEGMLVRTAILLRLATGACVHVLIDSGLSEADIEPWASSLSLSRGLWPENDSPDDSLDLWADTQIALEALDDDSSNDLHGLLQRLMPHLSTLGQTERVIAWSFL